MINILIALNVWKDDWHECHVKFYVDNLAVVQICNGGYTKDAWLAACIRNIWLLTAIYDITLAVFHIPGYKNVTADLLSRWNNTVEHTNKLHSLVPDAGWRTVSPSWFELNHDI